MARMSAEERIEQLEKELRIGGKETEERLLDLRAVADRLKLENAALKNYLRERDPEFGERFARIYERTLQEVDPEAEGSA